MAEGHLDKRVDPSAQDNQAIISAAKKGNFEIVKLLLPHVKNTLTKSQKIIIKIN